MALSKLSLTFKKTKEQKKRSNIDNRGILSMEDHRPNITNKNGRKKIIHPLSSLSIGDGIAGLLVFGGALALAGFMAVASLASNKNKAKGKGNYDHQPRPTPQEVLLEDDSFKSEDDLSFIQHSTTQYRNDACCWTSNMSMNRASSPELLSQTMVLEDKIDLKPNGEENSPIYFQPQEIEFSDHSLPGSATSSNENRVAEEFFNSPSDQAKELDKNEPQDDLKSTTTETTHDDDVDEDDDDDADEDDDVDLESDDVLDSGEEGSSKASGNTSLDYNEEPIWPAELIQEPQDGLKGDYCDADDEAMIVKKDATLNKKANFSLVLNDQPSLLRTWFIPLLLLGLLSILVPLIHAHRNILCP